MDTFFFNCLMKYEGVIEHMVSVNKCRFIEGDFDAYVKEIQQPYVWGGEPEILMASHVLK